MWFLIFNPGILGISLRVGWLKAVRWRLACQSVAAADTLIIRPWLDPEHIDTLLHQPFQLQLERMDLFVLHSSYFGSLLDKYAPV